MLTPGFNRWGQTPLHFGTSLPSGIQRADGLLSRKVKISVAFSKAKGRSIAIFSP
jgi:hypothetical protein